MEKQFETIAINIADALKTQKQIDPVLSESVSSDHSYAIARRVRGILDQRPAGRKVGFTNRAIWPIYGVSQPIWGMVFAESLYSNDQPIHLADYAEPRIEPEIVLGLKTAPQAGMDREQLAKCIDWFAPGIEIVQSIYPNWKFSIGDTIAAQGLHGCLILGEKTPATKERLNGLPSVPVELIRGSETVDHGKGENALDGPVDVLAHLTSLVSAQDPLQVGEFVSTGTLTDAWPLKPGETWTARYGGVMDTELSVRFV